MPDALFDTLYDATAAVPMAPVSEIQRRARRHVRHRRVTAVALAGIAVVAAPGAVVLIGDHPDNSPAPPAASAPVSDTSSPSDSPGPSGSAPGQPEPSGSPATNGSSARPGLTSVPAGAMLQPADLGRGWTVKDDPDAEGDWHFDAVIGYCPADWAGSLPERRDRRVREASPGQPEAGLVQEVKLFQGNRARDAFAYYRAGAVACARHVSRLGGTEITVSVAAEGFAGDLSMVVRTQSQYGVGVFVFVVVGELFTQFTAPGDSVTTGRDLGVKAARRMCAAASRC